VGNRNAHGKRRKDETRVPFSKKLPPPQKISSGNPASLRAILNAPETARPPLGTAAGSHGAVPQHGLLRPGVVPGVLGNASPSGTAGGSQGAAPQRGLLRPGAVPGVPGDPNPGGTQQGLRGSSLASGIPRNSPSESAQLGPGSSCQRDGTPWGLEATSAEDSAMARSSLGKGAEGDPCGSQDRELQPGQSPQAARGMDRQLKCRQISGNVWCRLPQPCRVVAVAAGELHRWAPGGARVSEIRVLESSFWQWQKGERFTGASWEEVEFQTLGFGKQVQHNKVSGA
jgi:hypothetical protein